MNRTLYHATFAAGLLAIAWVAAGYVSGNPLALALVALIGAFFLMGALELHRYQQASTGLAQVLATTTHPPPDLGPWIAQLPASLRNSVRLRVEGERVALPGPALTPYLAGLLVLLGMLGTFLGMVVTLQGTGLALQSAADVEAIRASLAAPVKGLGLAFGTSVAGVAASATLGLMSALARRERQACVRQLDACMGAALRGFSRTHQREESWRLQQAQAAVIQQALPALVTQLQAVATQMAQMTGQGRALQDGLLAGQARFHAEAQRAYTGLAESVDRSLTGCLTDSARLAGAAIEPAVRATMAGLARETASLREALTASVQLQLDGTAARLDASTTTLLDGVSARLDRSAADWAQSWGQALATLEATSARHEQQRIAAIHDSLGAMTATLQQQGQHAAAAVAERQQQICTVLERSAQAIAAQAGAQAHDILGELSRLVLAATEAPRAAAEVIGELRRALSDSLVRDNAVLDERNRLLGTLGSLLDAVNHASTEQRGAIDALVHGTSEMLDRVGARFAGTVDAESRLLQSVAAQVTGSAAEVASLGEGFGVAVQLFSRASEQLMAQLQRIEAALGHSMARSDEQLAYYVAQAREIIDLTLGSQKQIVEDLQQLGRAPAAAPAAMALAAAARPAAAPVEADLA